MAFFISHLNAQHLQHWGEKEGLSYRIVNYCLRTSDGFLWLATGKGLCRFDGYEFLPIGKSKKWDISNNLITQVLESEKGVLWVASDNGISIINLNSNEITDVFRHTAAENSLSDNYVLQIYQTPDRTIWVCTADGIFHKYLGNGRFRRYYNSTAKDRRFGNRPLMIAFQNHIWLKSQDRGVYKIEPVSGKIVQRYLTNPTSIDEGGFTIIPRYGLLCMTKEGVKVYHVRENKFKTLQIKNIKDIYKIVPDKKGDWWVAAYGRKRLFHYSNETIKDVSGYLSDYSQNTQINMISPGQGNDLWLCTNSGLYKFIVENPLFTSILRKDQFEKPLYVSSFRGFMQDSAGDIFMGGYGGLFKLNEKHQVKQLFDNIIYYSPNVLIDENKKYLWVVSEGFGMFKVDKKEGKIIKQPKDKDKYNYLIAGIRDTGTIFLLGGYDELVWYNSATNNYRDLHLKYNGIIFSRPFVKFIYKDKNKFIWICTHFGIFVLDPTHNIIARYYDAAPDGYRIPVNKVNHILEDKKGNIWVSTEGGGACKIDLKNHKITVINTEKGLADNTVASILEDSSGMIWVATYNGLSVIEPVNNQINNFYDEDGLSDNEFNSASCLYTSNGSLFFGGINGVNICKGYKVLQNKIESGNKIIISDIEMLGDNNEIEHIHNLQQLRKDLKLSYKYSYLEVSFFNTDFSHSERNIFYYKMEGLNDNWIPLEKKNSIRFASLSPGKYILHIRGKSSKNNLDAEEAVLRIEVQQIFYKTWWFALISIICIASIFAGLANSKVQQVNELAALRAKISSDLHDDVGSVLTRVAMQAEIIEEEVSTKHQEVMKSIVNSCRMAMSNMRDVIWSTDSHYRNVGNLFDKITEMVQQTMEYSPISYKLIFEPELYELEISQFQKQEIFFIIKEAFHNIVKHATGNLAELRVFKVKNEIIFIVYNNGPVEEKVSHTGMGTMNMIMRSKRINASLIFDTSEGFLIKLVVKLKRTYFSW